MRLVGFGFTRAEDGPLAAGYTPLANVTVLIGPNDSGKTSTLDLLAAALAPAKFDAGPGLYLETPPRPGRFVFAECTTGERDLLLTSVADPRHDPETAGRDWEDEIEEAGPRPLDFMGPRAEPRGGIAQCAVELEERLGAEHATLVLDALQATRLFAFEVTYRAVNFRPVAAWTLHWCLPADHALAAVARAQVLEISLPSDSCPIPLWTLGETALSLLPEPVLVPAGMSSVLTKLEDAVGVLAMNVRWNDDTDELYDDSVSAGYDDHGQWVIGEAGGTAVRVDPLVEALVAAAERVAQEALPGFVRSAYELRLRIQPILHWGRDGRLEATLHERTGTGVAFAVDRAAAGLRTWIEIAVLEAAALVDAFVGVAGFTMAADHEWDHGDVAEPAVIGEFRSLMRTDSISGAPDLLLRNSLLPRRVAEWVFSDLSRQPVDVARYLPRILGRPIYLIDEPERHVQVGLQRVAATWIEERFREHDGQAVVATHSPAFLEGAAGVQIVRVNRKTSEDALAPIDATTLRATDDLAREMGFDRGELLAGVAAILYVEGSVDRIVLQGLFAPELAAGRIAVRAFGGTYNITEILVDPLLAFTTARVAVLVDNVSDRTLLKLRNDADARRELANRRDEAGWLARLLIGAERHGRAVEVYGLSVRDVFFHLDDVALRRVSPSWPRHETAWHEWELHRKANSLPPNRWKDYFLATFGIRVDNETASLASLDMRERGAQPDELREILESVERLGLEPR